MDNKKNILTYAGLKKLEDELEHLKVVKRKEVSQKIKEAREQGDLSENAEYDAAKDEQRDIEARIEEIEKILKKPHSTAEWRSRPRGHGTPWCRSACCAECSVCAAAADAQRS